ncbi:hypothetical protein QZH41_001719 [Actinostola sp. cb2023]|nr:hypothetical protein QZH41_001719 [Actinostola sp. cb2023]
MLKRKFDDDSRSVESNDSIDSTDSTSSKGVKRVRFDQRIVFHFPRTQGSSCVPSNGGYTLGMKRQHAFVEHFKFSEQDDSNVDFCYSSDTSDDDEDEDDDDEDDDDSTLFMPIPQKTRKAILKDAGVKKIDKQEAMECMQIRFSRQICGCDCKDYCDPESCSCSLNGINCQVDRDSFPCGCVRNECHNPNGRHEYDPISVRRHFIDTILKLRGQKYIWDKQILQTTASTSGAETSASKSVITVAVA